MILRGRFMGNLHFSLLPRCVLWWGTMARSVAYVHALVYIHSLHLFMNNICLRLLPTVFCVPVDNKKNPLLVVMWEQRAQNQVKRRLERKLINWVWPRPATTLRCNRQENSFPQLEVMALYYWREHIRMHMERIIDASPLFIHEVKSP